MATSQFPRSSSLIDTLKGYLTPNVVRNASSMIGESESSTASAMHSTVPALLGGLLNFSSTREGANTLAGMARDGGYSAAAENPAALFSGGSTSSVMNAGQTMIGKIFGDKASSVRDHIASSSGIKPSSASALMSLMAPLALGSVWKMVGPQGQSGSGIMNLLRGQQKEIAAATPSGLSHMLGLGGRPVAAPLPSGIYEREERAAAASPPKANYEHEERYDAPARATTYEPRTPSGGAKWLPWLLVALIALGLLSYLVSRARSRTVQPTRVAVGNVILPGSGRIFIPQGTINFNLASYLASGTIAPRTFIFDHLNFESGSAQLTPDSNETVNNLATILKAYPHATIQLAGHTDNTGNPQTNQQLSLDRANAVKTMLVNSGVDGNRISTVGYGQDRPITTNDTEQGRARNRRTELTVKSK